MKYEVLELEVTRFENADVVTASGTTTGGQTGGATSQTSTGTTK